MYAFLKTPDRRENVRNRRLWLDLTQFKSKVCLNRSQQQKAFDLFEFVHLFCYRENVIVSYVIQFFILNISCVKDIFLSQSEWYK